MFCDWAFAHGRKHARDLATPAKSVAGGHGHYTLAASPDARADACSWLFLFSDAREWQHSSCAFPYIALFYALTDMLPSTGIAGSSTLLANRLPAPSCSRHWE